MEPLILSAGWVYAVGVVASIVFVAQVTGMMPKQGTTKKQFGPAAWGVYQGISPRESKSMKTIESSVSGCDIQRIAGSQSYGKGG